ncbi:hypothetical protein [Fodinibius salinus]|nr:hypothetical protein [Fodinibius salinus]
MAAKNNKPPSKKEMSEGKAITITVLLIAAGLIALIYGVQFMMEYFFPNF